MEHTPGPWKIEERMGHAFDARLVIVAPDVNRIAIISKNGGAADHDANARLIAAAPDLLEALQKLCDWHETNATWDKTKAAYYEAKQAIARATDKGD